jgi:formate dehydrogenase subunit gamma
MMVSAVTEIDEAVQAALDRHRGRPGPLLCVLHAVQDALGCIPPAAVPAIAAGLNLSRAEVHGVISFYGEFRSAPAGRHIVQICRAEACQAVGARRLEQHAKNLLGIDYGATTADGLITLEPVYCLGNCACGPSVRVDDAVFARMTAARFDALLAELRAEGEPQ